MKHLCRSGDSKLGTTTFEKEFCEFSWSMNRNSAHRDTECYERYMYQKRLSFERNFPEQFPHLCEEEQEALI